jgi:hypothetical protein
MKTTSSSPDVSQGHRTLSPVTLAPAQTCPVSHGDATVQRDAGQGRCPVRARSRTNPTGQDRIAALNPETDFEAIYRISGEEFGWETRRALELAILHTFAAPEIAAVLDSTGKFTSRGKERYHDTIKLLRKAGCDGLDSPRGHQAIRAIRQIHGRFPINDDEMRYVLATFVVIPVRWIRRYGWRTLTPAEIDATARYYSRLGTLMGITDVPAGYQAFAAVLDEYERRHHAPTPAGQRLTAATIGVLASGLGRLPRPAGRWCIRAALTQPLRASLGLPASSPLATLTVHAVLRTRARVVRLRRTLAAWRQALTPGRTAPPDITEPQQQQQQALGLCPWSGNQNDSLPGSYQARRMAA